MLERFSNTAAEAWARAQDAAARVLTLAVRLGVTGLSRSGKTVFITSLVHNILAGNALPFFEPLAQGRIVRAYLSRSRTMPCRASTTRAISKSSPPLSRTAGKHAPDQRVAPYHRVRARRHGVAGAGHGTLHLDIVDYPGEWLLDLPLLDLSYEEWSRQAIALAREAARASAAKDWLAFLASADALGAQDKQTAQKGAGLFTRSAQVPGGGALAFEPAAGPLSDAGRP